MTVLVAHLPSTVRESSLVLFRAIVPAARLDYTFKNISVVRTIQDSYQILVGLLIFDDLHLGI